MRKILFESIATRNKEAVGMGGGTSWLSQQIGNDNLVLHLSKVDKPIKRRCKGDK